MKCFQCAVIFIVFLNINGSSSNIIQSNPSTPHPVVPLTEKIETIENSNKTVTTSRPTLINNGKLEGRDHECYRECVVGDNRVCYYHFELEWYLSMSKACSDCPFNKTDCNRIDCVPANGVTRAITVINRKMPGPSIQVCQNDTIVVDVNNRLQASGTTMHWHGMHQRETPFMDGAPFVTQCPIQPESTFRYEFIASQPGTNFYHSHIGLQRADGAFGSLIVRRPNKLEPNKNLYDYDLPEHTIMINDWANTPAISVYTNYYHSSGANLPGSLLINGRGRFNVTRSDDTNVTRSAISEPARFNVESGGRYLFRLVNAEFLVCPVELSVDGHDIIVIASDGVDLQPAKASSFVSYAGERYDFIIVADKKVDNYWIKVRGLLVCEGLPQTNQVAVLHYKGAPDREPGRIVFQRPPGVTINAENQGEETTGSTVSIAQLKSIQGPDDVLKPVPDHKFYIGYDLYGKNNTEFHRQPYAFNQVQNIYRANSPQFNHISMALPTSPLLVTRPPSESFCNAATINSTCIQNFCKCPHVISVKLNSVVELVLVDEGKDFSANHPFHLHGHSFRVIGQRKINNSTTTEEVKKLDSLGQLRRNLGNAPIKDTVFVPDGGYVILRFKASNPGYWLFHCHIEFHADIGMSLVFKVGEHGDMKRVPFGFPMCGNYMGSPFNM